MTDSIYRDRPLVFVSFAGNDRPTAVRLRKDLDALGFDAFVDEHCIQPGENLHIAINKALTRSSFCVLLWSRHTKDRPWVEEEWTVALSRSLSEKRSFLVVVMLDETELPLLLATRKYLDASSDSQWDKTVAELVRIWRRDRGVDTPVVPAPNQATLGRSGNGGMIELYVRNRALSVSHVVAVPSTINGSELFGRVRKTLDLRDSESKLGGIVSLRVAYELRYRNEELTGKPLSDLGIGDGDTVDLIMHGEFVSHGQPVSTWTFRHGPVTQRSPISPQVARTLIDAAFGHLTP